MNSNWQFYIFLRRVRLYADLLLQQILGSIDISESDLNKNDRLKSKLRSGVSIHSSKRAQILKKIILGDKPIIDGDFVDENNTSQQFGSSLEKSSYFESSLFTGK